MTALHRLVLFFILFELASSISILKRANEPEERIDCYPDALSPFSNYSKDACLARSCLFEDETPPGLPQCYLSPNYGYVFQQLQATENGIRLHLQRNQAVGSMFPGAIENVILDVQYYTNDIIRFKLYDKDNQRYEVKFRKIIFNMVFDCFLLGADSINTFTWSSIITSI